MTTTQAAAPTITSAGTRPATPRKLFVTLPVGDLQRAVTFYEALGFTFNLQFTDATAAAMLVGEDAYAMLMTRERFATFTTRRTADPREVTGALLALSAASRAEVDALVQRAVAAGGRPGRTSRTTGSCTSGASRTRTGTGGGCST
jgi:predicted lactoylglutathione lyase